MHYLSSFLKVLTPTVVLKRGETGEIILRPTVGIGCHYSSPEDIDTCTFMLAMVSLDAHECDANIGLQNGITNQRFCSKTVIQKDMSKNISIIIAAVEKEDHSFSASYKIELITDDNFHNPLWGKYRLPDIQVCAYACS